MAKLIYKASSSFDFLWSVLLRMACIAAIIYFSFHYNENPVVIIVLCILCLGFFLLIGNDEITVYEDRVIDSSTSLVSVFLKGKTYNINNIRSVCIPKEAKATADEIIVASVLLSILPKMRHIKRSKASIINLELKTGKIIQLSSSIDEDEMRKVAEAINCLITTNAFESKRRK